MIVSCIKCNKKFEVEDSLIPSSGRLLKCGSCSHQWHYIPEDKLVEPIKLEKKVTLKQESKKIKKKDSKANIFKKKSSNDFIEKNENIGFFSLLLVFIISIIAIVLIAHTFKLQLVNIVPDIDLYLINLNEVLKDIFLFFNDLI